MAVAAAAAVLTKNMPIATSVVDTVRRHPAMLAQTALTIDHLSKGRFILGLGSGELENTVPYGFDFAKPVSRLRGGDQGHQAAVGERRPGRFRGRVLPPRACPDGYRAVRRQVPADLDRRRRPAHAGDHRALCRRLVAGGRLHAGGLRRQAEGRPRRRRAGGPRSDGDRAGDHPDLPDRRRRRDRRDARGAAGQVDHPDAHRRGPAPVRLSSTRWGRTGAASWTSIPVKLSREKIIGFCEEVDTQAILRHLPVRHAQAGRAEDQGLLRCRHAGVQADGLRRHGRAQVRRRLRRQGARDRGRIAALVEGS